MLDGDGGVDLGGLDDPQGVPLAGVGVLPGRAGHHPHFLVVVVLEESLELPVADLEERVALEGDLVDAPLGVEGAAVERDAGRQTALLLRHQVQVLGGQCLVLDLAVVAEEHRGSALLVSHDQRRDFDHRQKQQDAGQHGCAWCKTVKFLYHE